MKKITRKKTALRGYAAILTVVFIAAAIVVNLLVGLAEDHWALTMDMSPNRFTSFTEETKTMLESVDRPVHIYLLFQPKTTSELRINLEEITAHYRVASPMITVETIDPITEPGRVNTLLGQQMTLSEGSIIVTNDDLSRVKVIRTEDLFSSSQAGANGETLVIFNGEVRLTSAIMYILSDSMPRVFFLTGHDELNIGYCAEYVNSLIDENYEVNELTLGADELKPGDMVVALSPQLDLTEDEYNQMRAFIQSGGRLFYINDPTSVNTANIPNFMRLLSYFNLTLESGIVVEDESETTHYISSQTNLIPTVEADNNVTKSITDARIILPRAGAVKGPEVGVSGFTFHNLLTTSSNAFLKPVSSDSTITERQGNEETGPFNLAMSVISQPDFYDKSKDIRIVAVNDIAMIVDSSYLKASDNLDFCLNASRWLVNREDAEIPAARTVATMVLAIPNAMVFWWIAAIIVLIIPGLLLAGGVVIWLVRRRL